MNKATGIIRFRDRAERVLETIFFRGRRYFALEKLSRREAYRIYDPHAGPDGDFRVLYRIPYSPQARQKIETLRRLAGPTANRNFPYIVEYGRQGTELIVVMTWIWGKNLGQFLREVRNKQLPPPSVTETIRLFRGLAHGVAHYHRRSHVIHGDISPANILLTSGTSNLVLVDFGSAWPIEASPEKNPGDGISPPYAAPERIAHHAVEDFRADAFSLAVVAYQTLTQEIPFDGLGGNAGLPSLIGMSSPNYLPPSKLISNSNRLPANSVHLLDELFRVSLALHPDGRQATRAEWLAAWDKLHFSLQKGDRLSPWENRIAGWFQSLARIFYASRKADKS